MGPTKYILLDKSLAIITGSMFLLQSIRLIWLLVVPASKNYKRKIGFVDHTFYGNLVLRVT